MAAAVVGMALLMSAVDRETPPPTPTATTTATPATALAGFDPAAVARGKGVYGVSCIACHGATGRGDGPAAAGLNPPPVDFTSPIHRAHGEQELILLVTNGIPGSAMPAFGGQLTPDEIRDVVTYVRSLAGTNGTDVALAIPPPEECTIAPRYPSDLRPGSETPPGPAPTVAPPVGPEGFAWPHGDAASAADVAAMTRTIREFVACANAGDYPRRLALYTDRYLRPFYAALDSTGRRQALDLAATPPAALSIDEQHGIQQLDEFSRLPDGRLGAHVMIVDPVNHPHTQDVILIFATVGDRWLIDEILVDTRSQVSPATPESMPAALPGTPVTSAGLIVRLLPGTLVIEITDPRGRLVEGATVTMTATLGGTGAVSSAQVEEVEPGRYAADLMRVDSGPWQIEVEVVSEGRRPATFVFRVP